MLILSFTLAAIIFCLQGVACLPFSLTSFAPFLSLLILSYPRRKDIFKMMAISCLVGTFLDLFADAPMGLFALSYTLASALLSRFRNFFLCEKPLHLILFTTFFSLSVSLIQIFFFFLFDRRIPIQGEWILIDRLGVALLDGIYALIWHAGPFYLFQKARRKWDLYWLKTSQT